MNRHRWQTFIVLAVLALGLVAVSSSQAGSPSTAKYIVAEVPAYNESVDQGQARFMERLEVCVGSFMDCTFTDFLDFPSYGQSDVGNTMWTDGSTPFFGYISGNLTNGTDDAVIMARTAFDSAGNTLNLGGGITSEAAFFGTHAGPNGIDLAGYNLTRIGFRLDSIALVPVPGVSYQLWITTGAYLFEAALNGNVACMNGGWKTLKRSNGTPFKNQGDCIQYGITGQ